MSVVNDKNKMKDDNSIAKAMRSYLAALLGFFSRGTATSIKAEPESASSTPMAALLSQDKNALEQHPVAVDAGKANSGVLSDVAARADAVAAAAAIDAVASQSQGVEISEMPSVSDAAPSDQPAPSLTPTLQAKPEPAPALSLQPPMPQSGRRAELLPQ